MERIRAYRRVAIITLLAALFDVGIDLHHWGEFSPWWCGVYGLGVTLTGIAIQTAGLFVKPSRHPNFPFAGFVTGASFIIIAGLLLITVAVHAT